MRFDNGLTRWMLAIGALVLGLSVEPASAQCQVTERARLSASDGQVGDQFGTAVSVSGQLALIGSGWPFDRDSAYVFRFDGSSWIEEAKLTAPDAPDRFGQSVSISSDLMSGDVALIGAFFDDDGGTNVGSAYVFRFDGSSWVQEQKLLADDGAPGDRFGISVSISGDLAVIGAYRDDDGGTNAGSAYVFRFDGAQWNQEAKLIASDADSHAEFGFSVSTQEAGGLLPGNEDVAVIGAPGHIGGGTAYVFQVDASKWVQAAKLTSSDLAVFDVFGYSVSISGDVVVIGAWGDDDSGQASGSAYVYEEPPGGWQDMTQTGKLTASDGAANDRFGFSVSNSPDIVVIGARLDDDAGFSSGSAYAFKKPA
ncbi:MAG: FG-GAP repeat protein, partial [Planctomycetes bacterium]|nr:FG-GAP repeat protein [Planctomycetota bacterium]